MFIKEFYKKGKNNKIIQKNKKIFNQKIILNELKKI